MFALTYRWAPCPERYVLRPCRLPIAPSNHYSNTVAITDGPRDGDIDVTLNLTEDPNPWTPPSNWAHPTFGKDLKAAEVATCRVLSSSSLSTPQPAADFTATVEGDNFVADLVHVYTICRQLCDLITPFAADVDETGRLRQLGNCWRWAWEGAKTSSGTHGRQPLRVIVHGGVREGALYHRGSRSLHFFCTSQNGMNLYACREAAIVVHELGHAILDAIKPDLYTATEPTLTHEGKNVDRDQLQARYGAKALHEAFADAMWIFYALRDVASCLRVVTPLSSIGALATTRSHVTVLGGLRNLRAEAEIVTCPIHETTATDEQAFFDAVLRDASFGDARTFLGAVSALNCGKGPYAVGTVFVAFLWDLVTGINLWVHQQRPAPHQLLSSSHVHALRLCVVASLLRMSFLITLGQTPTGLPSFHEIACAMAQRATLRATLVRMAPPDWVPMRDGDDMTIPLAVEEYEVIADVISFLSEDASIGVVAALVQRTMEQRRIDVLGLPRQFSRNMDSY
jgi:hypothetical protein